MEEVLELEEPWKNSSGYGGEKTPAKPEKVAPIEKASSLVRTGSIPIWEAANSSSRIAIQARPRRLSRKRLIRKIENRIITIIKKYHGMGLFETKVPIKGKAGR